MQSMRTKEKMPKICTISFTMLCLVACCDWRILLGESCFRNPLSSTEAHFSWEKLETGKKQGDKWVEMKKER